MLNSPEHAYVQAGPGVVVVASNMKDYVQQGNPTTASELCLAPTIARSRSSGRLQVCGAHSVSILLHGTLIRSGLDSPRIDDLASRYSR